MSPNPEKRPSDEAERSERRKTAWSLHLKGYTIRQIGEMLGVSRETARVDIRKELEAIQEDNLEIARGFRDEAVERLRALLVPLTPLAEKGEWKAAEEIRKIVMDMARLTGNLIERKEMVLNTTDVDSILDVLKQRKDSSTKA